MSSSVTYRSVHIIYLLAMFFFPASVVMTTEQCWEKALSLSHLLLKPRELNLDEKAV